MAQCVFLAISARVVAPKLCTVGSFLLNASRGISTAAHARLQDSVEARLTGKRQPADETYDMVVSRTRKWQMRRGEKKTLQRTLPVAVTAEGLFMSMEVGDLDVLSELRLIQDLYVQALELSKKSSTSTCTSGVSVTIQ